MGHAVLEETEKEKGLKEGRKRRREKKRERDRTTSTLEKRSFTVVDATVIRNARCYFFTSAIGTTPLLYALSRISFYSRINDRWRTTSQNAFRMNAMVLNASKTRNPLCLTRVHSLRTCRMNAKAMLKHMLHGWPIIHSMVYTLETFTPTQMTIYAIKTSK